MPRYKITDTRTGRRLTLTGERPPTEAELQTIFGTPQPTPNPDDAALAGVLGRGAQAVRQGLSLRDFPHLAARTASAPLFDVPEIAARHPLSGLPGAGLRLGVALRNVLPPGSPREPTLQPEPNFFPEPMTPAGRRLGTELGVAGGLVDVELFGLPVAKAVFAPPVKSLGRSFTLARTDLMNTGRDVVEVGKQLATKHLIADRPAVIGRLEKVTRRLAERDLRHLADTIQQETNTIARQLNQESFAAVKQAKPILRQYFGQRSREYGRLRDQLIMASKARTTRNDVSRALDVTLQQAGLRGEHARPPSGAVEQALLDMATDFADIRRAKEIVPAESVIRLKQDILGAVPSAERAGKQPYSRDEHIVTTFLEHFSDIVEKQVPGLAKLNATYRPFIQLKRQAVQSFQPFGGEFETKTGEALLKRAVSNRGAETGEAAMIEALERETGIPFAQPMRTLGQQLQDVKTGGEMGKRTIKSATEQRIIQLEAQRRRAAIKQQKPLLGLARRGLGLFRGRLV